MARYKAARWLRPVVCLAAWLPILILVAPYLGSVYHLEAAGRAMEAAAPADRETWPAVTHLKKVVAREPDDAQTYRLLGRAYRAQGDWPAALEALGRYTRLRPDDPLGYLELAGVYEAIEARAQAMHLADLLADLPGAAVGTPETVVDTPFAQADGPAWYSYVATTTFSLPPNFGQRPTLFMHAPSWVTYTLTLPSQPAMFRFGMGLHPQAHDWPGDGATFEVFLDGDRVFLEHLDKALARQGWHERTVDLSPWAGEKVQLALAVTPGPVADPSGDWAGWGEPQVVDAQLPALEALQSGPQIVEAWLRAGLTARDFIRQGEEAQRAGRYDEATAWYGRALRLAADLGDSWYKLGQLYEEQQQWPEALAAYQQASTAGRLDQTERSSVYYRMGLIYQTRLDPRQPEAALAAYQAALAADDFSSVADAADSHYRRGQLLREQGGNPDLYIAGFRQAIALNPRHVWAHILLGVAVYQQAGDAVEAETRLLQAIELAAQNKWACYYLGEVYRQEGRSDEAAAMYRRALEIDPAFESARERLAALKGE